MSNVYFLPRAQAARSRALTVVERPRVVPTRELTPLLERPDGPPPAKLSAQDAARLFGVNQGGRLWKA